MSFISSALGYLGDRAARPMPQYGAVPFRLVEGRTAFLLITSRRTGRWIFPKGSLIEGLSPQGTAAREAFEEAGVEGVVFDEPLGRFHTVKQRIRRQHLLVTLYPLLVTRQLDDWQDKGRRYRHWVLLKEAVRLASDPGAVAAVRKLDAAALALAERASHEAEKTE